MSRGDTPPPVTKPTGAAPEAEPITTLAESATGATGPALQRPSAVTWTTRSSVRLSAKERSVAAT